MTDNPIPHPSPIRGRMLLLGGLGLAVLGIGIFAIQIFRQSLALPWYVPMFALVGVVLVTISMVQRRTAARIIALVGLTLLTGLEFAAWQVLRLPAYTGPIAVGRPFPAFASTLADGRPFTQADLAGKNHTALVFFRGRW